MIQKLVAAALIGLFCLGGTAASAQAQDGKSTKQKKLDAKYKTAIEHMKEKEFDEAKEILDEIVEADPSQANAWALMAYIHNNRKEYKDAVKVARKAVRIDDEHVLGWSELAFGLFMLKKYADAIPALEKTIELSPTTWAAYDALAACYREEGMDDEADALMKTKQKLLDKAKGKKPAPKPNPKDDDQ